MEANETNPNTQIKKCKIIPESCPKCNASTMSAVEGATGSSIHCSMCNSGLLIRWIDYETLPEYSGYRLLKVGGRWAAHNKSQRKNKQLKPLCRN